MKVKKKKKKLVSEWIKENEKIPKGHKKLLRKNRKKKERSWYWLSRRGRNEGEKEKKGGEWMNDWIRRMKNIGKD